MAKGRSDQGRGNKNKGGKTAGKGFVAPRASRADKKAIGKGLAKTAAAVAPGGAAVKGVAKAAKVAKPAIKKAAAKSVEKRSLKAANNPAKDKVASKARARGKEYQSNVDDKLSFKDKGVKQRYKTLLARKGPGWMGTNEKGKDVYLKVPKSGNPYEKIQRKSKGR